MKKPNIINNNSIPNADVFSYLNLSMNNENRDRRNIWIFLDSELHEMNGSPYKFINQFERIDGMCIKDSYVVGMCQIYLKNIQNINNRCKWFYLKSDII